MPCRTEEAIASLTSKVTMKSLPSQIVNGSQMNGPIAPQQAAPITEATHQQIHQVHTENRSSVPMVAVKSMNSQAEANALPSVASGTQSALVGMKATKSRIEKEFSPFSPAAAKQHLMKSGKAKLHAYTTACSNDYAPTSNKFSTRKEGFTSKRPPLADLILAAETDEDFWLAFEAEHKLQSQLSERSSYSDSRPEQSSCGE